MDDSDRMGMFQGPGRLNSDASRLLEIGTALSVDDRRLLADDGAAFLDRQLFFGLMSPSDEVGDRQSVDVLHREVMDSAFAADGVDRHDIRMMQRRGRAGLVLKTLQLFRIHVRSERQHFQRDSSTQRNLFRFVNNPHPAPTEKPDDPEVAKNTRHATGCRRCLIDLIDRVAPVGEHPQGRHQPLQLLGVLRIGRRDRGKINLFARFQPASDFVDEVGEGGCRRTAGGHTHGELPSVPSNWSRRR